MVPQSRQDRNDIIADFRAFQQAVAIQRPNVDDAVPTPVNSRMVSLADPRNRSFKATSYSCMDPFHCHPAAARDDDYCSVQPKPKNKKGLRGLPLALFSESSCIGNEETYEVLDAIDIE